MNEISNIKNDSEVKKMTKKENIIIDQKWILLIKILLIISCPFFTFMVSNGFDINRVIIGCILSFITAILIFCLTKIDNTINKKKALLYILISCYLITNTIEYTNNNISLVQESIKNATKLIIPTNVIMNYLGLFALPITIFFVKWFFDHIFDKIIEFLKNLTKSEKKYLYFTFIAATIISIFVINITVVFSRPYHNYDVIFTSDTGALLKNNVYINISHRENDIRQPLFGMFAMPFGLTAKAISKFCFFFRSQYEYETVITIFQALMLATTTILLSRLLKINEDKKKYFYLLISCSFPYILFTLLLEQYVVGLFYLISAIYYYSKNPYKTNYLYIGATGTLITSGIIFPLITKFKNFKQWLSSIFKCFIGFIASIIITGQTPQVYTLIKQIKLLLKAFAKEKAFTAKLYQYTAFVKGLVIPNKGNIHLITNKATYQSITYTSIEWIGVIILLICFISFILNRKNKMALLSILWVIFSSIILLFVGWGTSENGLILYSVYFAWAFYALIYLLIDKIGKKQKIFKLLLAVIVAIMIYTSICELINMFSFGIKYYP